MAANGVSSTMIGGSDDQIRINNTKMHKSKESMVCLEKINTKMQAIINIKIRMTLSQ